MERVEDEAELIVIVYKFAPCHAGANLVGLGVKTDADHVEILIGVSEIDLGLLGDGSSVLGVTLHKTVDLQHGLGHLGGRLHSRKIRKRWPLLQARDVQSGKLTGRGYWRCCLVFR